MDYNEAEDLLPTVVKTIFAWSMEGKRLPGYTRGQGLSYLCLLLGIERTHSIPHDAYLLCRRHPTVVIGLAGPHGWAVMRTLIIRGKKNIQLANRDRTKIKVRNKKRRDWRALQKEDRNA